MDLEDPLSSVWIVLILKSISHKVKRKEKKA